MALSGFNEKTTTNSAENRWLFSREKGRKTNCSKSQFNS
jgi:hypothetical protein